MPTIQLNFNHALNVSVQPTDVVYVSVPQTDQSGTNHPGPTIDTAPQAIGVVIEVDHPGQFIIVDLYAGAPTVNSTHYIFFSKDRRVNLSGVVGYFLETEYRNYTKRQAEMFATAADYVESSK
jgi:hypothetical protein